MFNLPAHYSFLFKFPDAPSLLNVSDMGNRFVWHEDNVFTFIINSDLKADDVLKLEVYNSQNKVGECE